MIGAWHQHLGAPWYHRRRRCKSRMHISSPSTPRCPQFSKVALSEAALRLRPYRTINAGGSMQPLRELSHCSLAQYPIDLVVEADGGTVRHDTTSKPCEMKWRKWQ